MHIPAGLGNFCRVSANFLSKVANRLAPVVSKLSPVLGRNGIIGGVVVAAFACLAAGCGYAVYKYRQVKKDLSEKEAALAAKVAQVDGIKLVLSPNKSKPISEDEIIKTIRDNERKAEAYKQKIHDLNEAAKNDQEAIQGLNEAAKSDQKAIQGKDQKIKKLEDNLGKKREELEAAEAINRQNNQFLELQAAVQFKHLAEETLRAYGEMEYLPSCDKSCIKTGNSLSLCPKEGAIEPNATENYVHGNYMKLGGIDICAFQYPLPGVQEKCWNLFIEQASIVLDFSGKHLRHPSYYPEKVNETLNYGSLAVTCISKEKIQDVGIVDADSYYLVQYEVKKDGLSHTVYRIHFNNWPDREGFPVEAIEVLLKNVQARIHQQDQQGKKVFIHCEGGFGRTGSFATALAIDDLIPNAKVEEYKALIATIKPNIFDNHLADYKSLARELRNLIFRRDFKPVNLIAECDSLMKIVENLLDMGKESRACQESFKELKAQFDLLKEDQKRRENLSIDEAFSLACKSDYNGADALCESWAVFRKNITGVYDAASPDFQNGSDYFKLTDKLDKLKELTNSEKCLNAFSELRKFLIGEGLNEPTIEMFDREMKKIITAGKLINNKDLGQYIESLILKGRQFRGPRFVESDKQLMSLWRLGLKKLSDLQTVLDKEDDLEADPNDVDPGEEIY